VNEIVDAILTWNPPFREENQCDFPELGFCQLPWGEHRSLPLQSCYTILGLHHL